MSRYAFALKPKWILGHILVVLAVIGFVNAGLWQWQRLDERRAFNDQVAANRAAPTAPVDEVLPPSAGFDDVPDVLDRSVTATGRYLADEEIVINAQASPDSVPGVWIVTPLELDDGRVLLVNRGWLPSNGPLTEPPADAAAPPGEVTVTGSVAQTQTPAEGASPEIASERQSNFLRIDIARISQQFSQDLVPAFVIRQDQTPPDTGARPPQNLALAELTPGPHLSYVLQWFGFAAVTVIGYPVLLWMIGRDRTGRRDERSGSAPDPDELPEGAFVDEHGVIDLTGVERPAPSTPR